MLPKAFQALQDAISLCIRYNVDPQKEPRSERAIYDFTEKQKIYAYNNIHKKIKVLKDASPEILAIASADQGLADEIASKIGRLQSSSLKEMDSIVKDLIHLGNNLPKKAGTEFQVPKTIPSEIADDVKADIQELNKTFHADCFRSCVILCGRILETALHRKYYETTNNDLLEKSPGIGLGNVIAKLRDKNVVVDPAITNQIHLVNQVRVHSVHKKKEAFIPTKEQTHAIILYTIDILRKLFDS